MSNALPNALPSDLSHAASAATGYTLPVFACAAAIAALRHLQIGWQAPLQAPLQTPQRSPSAVTFNLLNPPEPVTIPIEQVARLDATTALAIARSAPGDNLDLTRDTPIWAKVELNPVGQTEAIALVGGEGIGRQDQGQGDAAIYRYAQQLLRQNLAAELPQGQTLRVTIILPEGRSLAERTSNAAFGVIEGLSLLGTSGLSQPLSTPEQLQAFRAEVQAKAQQFKTLIFCIGENGLDLAPQWGLPAERLVKTANWLGPLLVEAGANNVENVLLFGYHGKLMKLAAGIFHTHNHVADGRLEILAAHCGVQGLPTAVIQAVFNSATAEAALQHLRALDAAQGTTWVPQVYGAIAQAIDERAMAYIRKYCDQPVQVGSILFDRERSSLVASANGIHLQQRLKSL